MCYFIPCDYNDIGGLEVHIEKMFLSQVLCILQSMRVWISGYSIEDASTLCLESKVSPVRSYNGFKVREPQIVEKARANGRPEGKDSILIDL